MVASTVSSRTPLEGDERTLGAVVPLARSQSDESSLVEGLIERSPAAVAELFDRYAPLVRRMLIRTLGSAVDIDDVMQETFLVIIRRCKTLRKRAALRSFVVGVSLRVARNELRKRRVRRWIGLEDAAVVPMVPGYDPIAAETLQRFYTGLDRMDASLRVLFVLRHIEGLELTELAEMCGCSLATVKRRLARGNQRFRAITRADPVLRRLLGGTDDD
jgi:RNA polymerase sigma-70 factor (ECF subfamily)